ncbi:hypothetical protein [Brevundimonas sp. GCM10030266]|jgi:hypothetical protein|uniref:hypothetical protein n=1 Tax=Brevundimonas sp. GCM10030266 TaxID=3273386 RepID=UPI0036142D5A
MKRVACALFAFSLIASSATAQTSIRPGERVQGVLDATDRTLADGSRYDCFTLLAAAGESVVITLKSSEFDAYLSITGGTDCTNPVALGTDDDSAGGSDAQIRMTLGPGAHSFRANAYRAGQGGRYELVVERR